jgi:FkbM family methyltransferase
MAERRTLGWYIPSVRIWKVLLLVGIVLAGLLLYPPARLFALVVAGRSPSCPWRQAIRSDANLKDQIAYNEKILKTSKMLGADPKGFEQWQTPKGTYWIPAGSRYVLPFNLAEQERRIYGSGDRFVQNGDVVLDCGANVGVFTREALNAGAKKVIAIEPAPENIECLRRNYAPEVAAGRVIVYPKGVWDKDDILPLNVDSHNSAADSFVIHPAGSHATADGLPLTTIDKLVSELGLDQVNFIKMDIEGAEPKALAGARDTLARWHPKLAISVYHEPDHPVVVPRVIHAAWNGYQLECGPCALENGTKIRPDIYWFR